MLPKVAYLIIEILEKVSLIRILIKKQLPSISYMLNNWILGLENIRNIDGMPVTDLDSYLQQTYK